MPPSEGRLTMSDVAAAAGVSRQTVSLVLADKPGPNAGTREHVLRVAEDLGFHVVGYDDTRTAALSYMDLTTVHQDATEMAEIAVQVCSERLGGQRSTGSDVVLTPALTIRGSTAAPR